LKKLQHAHIVRIMGTYVLGRKLSILLYPVANHNLETFLEAMNEGDSHENLENMRRSCKGFFTCLSSAMHYIHSKLTKHMDIKPKNILVRLENRRIAWGLLRTRYTVFIADFGIARSYQQLNATETDSPTSFTRKYAAPEVVLQDKRGLPADIFSLGCVFLEMIAVLNGMPGTGVNSLYYAEIMFRSPKHKTTTLTMDVLQTLLEESPSSDSSYCSNITTISRELSVLGSWRLIEFRVVVPRDGGLANLIQRMLSEDPEARPSARDLVFQFPSVQCCCDAGPVPLEALVSENSEPAS
jgi:serine/threonine protein kinase